MKTERELQQEAFQKAREFFEKKLKQHTITFWSVVVRNKSETPERQMVLSYQDLVDLCNENNTFSYLQPSEMLDTTENLLARRVPTAYNDSTEVILASAINNVLEEESSKLMTQLRNLVTDL
jgi:hypothetical protein